MKSYYKICLVICFAIAVKTKAGQLHFGQWIKTDTVDNFELYVFEMIIMQGVQNCIESCKAKKQCKFINFDHRANLCYHIGSKGGLYFDLRRVLEKKPGFSFGEKRDWDMTYFEDCDECNEYGVCGKDGAGKYSKRRNSGCTPPPKRDRAISKGNMYSVGNTVLYQCEDGYRTAHNNPVTSTCLGSGKWSSISILCLPEYAFEQEVYRHDAKSYKVIRHGLQWDVAKETCEQMGGLLVNIRSQREQNFIKTNITKSFDCYWTGGRRIINRVFRWLDGTGIDSGYKNWQVGQPDSSPGEEDCVGMYKGYDYRWNDYGCKVTCHVICELI